MLWSVAYANADATNSPEPDAFWHRIHIIALSVNRLLANVERTVEVEEEPSDDARSRSPPTFARPSTSRRHQP